MNSLETRFQDPYVMHWVDNFNCDPRDVTEEMRQYAKVWSLLRMYSCHEMERK